MASRVTGRLYSGYWLWSRAVMASALGVVVVVIALCGFASAAPLRAASSRSSAAGRLFKPDQLQNEINDLILPLLSPRRKSGSSKPQLQLTELLSDPQRRSKSYVKLASLAKSGEGKSRDKSPLAIFVADLPRVSGQRGRVEQADSSDEDDDVSRDGDHEEQDESADETREADHDQPEQHDEVFAHEEERTADDLERHDASNEVEPARDEKTVDEKSAAERVEDERVEDERVEDERVEDERAEEERAEDERVVDVKAEEVGAEDVRVVENEEHEAEDQTLDESSSTLQLLSQDIASAFRAEQATESTEDGRQERVMECVERKDSVAPEPSAEARELSAEIQERETLVQQAPGDYWSNYHAAARTGESGVGWTPGDSYVSPQKAYHLSFRFTK